MASPKRIFTKDFIPRSVSSPNINTNINNSYRVAADGDQADMFAVQTHASDI